MIRVPRSEFQALTLEAHRLLKDVPLKDVSAVDLPGEESGRTLADLESSSPDLDANIATRALFRLRFWLGKVFGWDSDSKGLPAVSVIRRLPLELAKRSLIIPGTPSSGFRVVYSFECESLSEIINATVHAFLCRALVRIDGGYRLYLAVYVRPVSRWTAAYMALIEPFRRFIVYPSLLRAIRRRWVESQNRG
jgi:hypothetical protein